MWENPLSYCEGWNFGPNPESVSSVWDVATKVIENYGSGELIDVSNPNALHEATLLTLDITKSRVKLNWQPRMNINQTVALTIDWYRRYRQEDPYTLALNQIEQYLNT